MIKKLVVLLACFGLVHLSACTSNESKTDSEVTSDFDSADLEQLDSTESMDVAADDASLGSDQLPEDALGESTTTTTTTTTETTQEPTLPDENAAPAMDVATSDALPSDPFAEQMESTTTPDTTVVETAPPPESNTTIVESSSSMDSSTTTSSSSSYSTEEEPPKKANVPLQKVATAPWKVGKVWYNTVYFARPGDSLSSISKMIYGKGNKVSELKKGNPTYAGSRGVKPGDKVYYNSPHRPDDSGSMQTYYEDNGIAAETYTAKDGDDLKKVSKSLLGYKDAWKEVWASNSVDSKGAIAAGTELRFWKGGAVAAAPAAPAPDHQEVAANPPPAMQNELAPPAPDMAQQMPPQELPPQQADGFDMPPPPPGDMAPPEMAPPPPDMAQQMPPPEMAPPPPPPPPVEAVNPPQQASHNEGDDMGMHAMDNDTTLALAVVGLAAAGLAILIVVRKKRRQKELEQHMDNTHVG